MFVNIVEVCEDIQCACIYILYVWWWWIRDNIMRTLWEHWTTKFALRRLKDRKTSVDNAQVKMTCLFLTLMQMLYDFLYIYIEKGLYRTIWHQRLCMNGYYTSQQKKGIFWFVGRYFSISFTTKNIGGMEIFGHQFCIYWTQKQAYLVNL